MAVAGGIVFKLEERRRDLFDHERSDYDESYSDVVDAFEHSGTVPLICFIQYEHGKLTHLAQGKRGKQAGIGRRILYMSNIYKLDSPIDVSDIAEKVPAKVRTRTEQAFADGGKLPPVTFSEVINAIRELCPETKPILDKFGRERADRIRKLSPKTQTALAYQKETVATALFLSRQPREVLQEWSPTTDTPASFLDGLPTTRLREDPMVIHDLHQMPGHDLVKKLPFNAAVFESPFSRLTVILANRQPLEEVTGADLIYYNETRKAFVMVQYKAMEHETGGNVFRWPQEQLTREVEEMDKLIEAMRGIQRSESTDGFRINRNPFFLKFCPRVQLNPDDTGLIKGMYLPLHLWKCIAVDDSYIGPKGGRILSFENVGRYFDNTTFASLVAGGWIGTGPEESELLEVMVRNTLQTGRTVAFAINHDRTQPTEA